MSAKEFMDSLGNNQSFPGVAKDDKAEFVRAAKMHADEGWSTEVTVSTQRVTSISTPINRKLRHVPDDGGRTGT